MERVHKPHNLAAIVRNCDAAGILEVHAVPPEEGIELSKHTSAGSKRWVRLVRHASTREAIEALHATGHQVVAAHPDPDAIDFREVDFTRPTAIMMGAELHGLSDEGMKCADRLIRIPMMGMVRSLNVSVATALLVYEAARQRQNAGMYAERRLDEERYRSLLFEWAYPRLARRYRSEGRPYPELSEDGEIQRD